MPESHGKEAVMRPILVVDDDPRIGRAIQGWLRYCGFRIQLSGSSAGGVTALDQFGFDLMIVDVFTPRSWRFRADQAVSCAGPHGAADRDRRCHVTAIPRPQARQRMRWANRNRKFGWETEPKEDAACTMTQGLSSN
jgi:CheY-like chemotaxis protein